MKNSSKKQWDRWWATLPISNGKTRNPIVLAICVRSTEQEYYWNLMQENLIKWVPRQRGGKHAKH